MNFYDFSAVKMGGKEVKMDAFQGKVVLVVNTASKCGLTPQLTGLEALYEKYQEQDFVILGFPCNQFAKQDPSSNHDISEFCLVNYGVKFPMFEKINVNGGDAHPLYQFLKEQAHGTLGNEIKWNFTKFLIDRNGNVVKRFSPIEKPEKLEKDIVDCLKQ